MADHDPPGAGYSGPAIDPTKNVLQLVEAASKRTDDLANLRQEFLVSMVREAIANVKEGVALRSEHSADLRRAESARIDSIRQVDREEVVKTAAAAQQAIQALAVQTSTLADTLRNQVAATATAASTQLAATTDEIGKRLSALERAQSEGTGKQAVSDPQLAVLIAEVRSLSGSQNKGEGRGAGQLQLVLIVGQVLGMAAVAFALFKGG